MKLVKRIIIAVVIAVFVYFLVFFLMSFKLDNSKELEVFNTSYSEEKSQILKEESKKIYSNNVIGYLTIEKIDMINNVVKDGVDKETLEMNIGHFSNTSSFNGNVCLAAHNYSVGESSLFKDINNLNLGDNIIYETKFGKRKYEVYKMYQISSNDFSILENTTNNILTLVTCIGTSEDIRLCVKAIEVKEE